MFTQLGKAALKFTLTYSFLSSLFVTLFTAYGVTPPELLTVMPLSVYKLVQSASSLSGGTWFMLYIFGIFGIFMMDLFTKLVLGLPTLFYKLAVLSGYPALAPPATAFGMLLQFSVYIAAYNMLIAYLRGGAGE